MIRARKGAEQALRNALLEVAEHVRLNETGTIGFHIAQDRGDPGVFTTCERFADRAAMDRHNGSDVVARLFAIARPIQDGGVVQVTRTEISVKD